MNIKNLQIDLIKNAEYCEKHGENLGFFYDERDGYTYFSDGHWIIKTDHAVYVNLDKVAYHADLANCYENAAAADHAEVTMSCKAEYDNNWSCATVRVYRENNGAYHVVNDDFFSYFLKSDKPIVTALCENQIRPHINPLFVETSSGDGMMILPVNVDERKVANLEKRGYAA